MVTIFAYDTSDVETYNDLVCFVNKIFGDGQITKEMKAIFIGYTTDCGKHK